MFSTKELEVFVSNSTAAVELKFVREESDIFDDSLSFTPQFTHQVFGENETIFGYRNLKIKLYYTPDHLTTYIGLSYDERVDLVKHAGIQPDNIIKIIAQHVPEGFITNLDEFTARLSRPSDFRPFRDLLHVYHRDKKSYEVYKCSMAVPGFEDYHSRLQTFLLWYVDAASFIDVDDEKWSFYLVYEKDAVNGRTSYAIVGYTSVYSFYAYPDKIRPRISQMLVLPPYQRKGHGSTTTCHLLQCLYDDLVPNPQVSNITVEDPSDEFSALRDFIDCRNALSLAEFQPPKVHKPFFHEAEKVCQQRLKLQKLQARRVYEILRLRATDRSNTDQYKEYRLAVKNRLNGAFQREQRDLRKLQQVMDPVELALTHPPVSHDSHMTQLQDGYRQLEKDYLTVIEKLAAAPNT